LVAACARNLVIEPHRNIRRCLYFANQVVRHSLSQRGTSNKNGDLGCEATDVKGGLPGRICAADYENLLASHSRCFGRCGSIENSASDERIDARQPGVPQD
jgi:hypothetical protein